MKRRRRERKSNTGNVGKEIKIRNGKQKRKELGEKSILAWRVRTGDTKGDLTNSGGK